MSVSIVIHIYIASFTSRRIIVGMPGAGRVCGLGRALCGYVCGVCGERGGARGRAWSLRKEQSAGSRHSCQPKVKLHILPLVWNYPLGKG